LKSGKIMANLLHDLCNRIVKLIEIKSFTFLAFHSSFTDAINTIIHPDPRSIAFHRFISVVQTMQFEHWFVGWARWSPLFWRDCTIRSRCVHERFISIVSALYTGIVCRASIWSIGGITECLCRLGFLLSREHLRHGTLCPIFLLKTTIFVSTMGSFLCNRGCQPVSFKGNFCKIFLKSSIISSQSEKCLNFFYIS